MILSNSWLCLGKLNYCLELLGIFYVKGILWLTKRARNYLGLFFKIATHGRLYTLLRSLRLCPSLSTLVHDWLLSRGLRIFARLCCDNRALWRVFRRFVERVARLLLSATGSLGSLRRKMLLDKLVQHNWFTLHGKSRSKVLRGPCGTSLHVLCIALLDCRINLKQLLLVRGHHGLIRHTMLLVLKLFFSLLRRSLRQSGQISRFFPIIIVTKLLLFALSRVALTRAILLVMGQLRAARHTRICSWAKDMESDRDFQITLCSLTVRIATLTRRVFEWPPSRIARLKLTVLELYQLPLMELVATCTAIIDSHWGRITMSRVVNI